MVFVEMYESRGRSGKGEGWPDRCAARGNAARTRPALPAFWGSLQNFSEGNLPAPESPFTFACVRRVSLRLSRTISIVSMERNGPATRDNLEHSRSYRSKLIRCRIAVEWGRHIGNGGVEATDLWWTVRYKLKSGHRLPCTSTTVVVDCEVWNGRCGSARYVKPAAPRARTRPAALPNLGFADGSRSRLPIADLRIRCAVQCHVIPERTAVIA